MLVFFLTINQDKKNVLYSTEQLFSAKEQREVIFFLNDRTQKELTKYMNKIINTTMCPVTQWIRWDDYKSGDSKFESLRGRLF